MKNLFVALLLSSQHVLALDCRRITSSRRCLNILRREDFFSPQIASLDTWRIFPSLMLQFDFQVERRRRTAAMAIESGFLAFDHRLCGRPSERVEVSIPVLQKRGR